MSVPASLQSSAEVVHRVYQGTSNYVACEADPPWVGVEDWAQVTCVGCLRHAPPWIRASKEQEAQEGGGGNNAEGGAETPSLPTALARFPFGDAENWVLYRSLEAHASALVCPSGWRYDGVEIETQTKRREGVLTTGIGVSAYYTTGSVRRSIGRYREGVDLRAVLLDVLAMLTDPETPVPWRRRRHPRSG